MTPESGGARTYDPAWDAIYQAGQHLNKYPFDAVVSFVFRNAPRPRARSEVRVLEVGCGAGNNLWFAAREGFQVAGIDGSADAIAFARQRMGQEALQADLRVGDFTSLPWPDASFDLAVDRAALTCCPSSGIRRALAELARVLRPGGRLFFNPYSTRHGSFVHSKPAADGLRGDIAKGTLKGVGHINFLDRDGVRALFAATWSVRSLQHVEVLDETGGPEATQAEWRIVAERS